VLVVQAIAAVAAPSPRAHTRNEREEAKVVRSINFPVPFSV
jgi:hypothetical protein